VGRVDKANLSEALDRCENFGDIFELVKRAVKQTLGQERIGLMLYLGNLPLSVGAFHQIGSNGIVMNRKLLNLVMASTRSVRELNAYVFSILLHEYLHSLGYLNEREVRKLVYEISEGSLGAEHPATDMALHGPMRRLPIHGVPKNEEIGDFEIVKDFERSNQNYIR